MPISALNTSTMPISSYWTMSLPEAGRTQRALGSQCKLALHAEARQPLTLIQIVWLTCICFIDFSKWFLLWYYLRGNEILLSLQINCSFIMSHLRVTQRISDKSIHNHNHPLIFCISVKQWLHQLQISVLLKNICDYVISESWNTLNERMRAFDSNGIWKLLGFPLHFLFSYVVSIFHPTQPTLRCFKINISLDFFFWCYTK